MKPLLFTNVTPAFPIVIPTFFMSFPRRRESSGYDLLSLLAIHFTPTGKHVHLPHLYWSCVKAGITGPGKNGIGSRKADKPQFSRWFTYLQGSGKVKGKSGAICLAESHPAIGRTGICQKKPRDKTAGFTSRSLTVLSPGPLRGFQRVHFRCRCAGRGGHMSRQIAVSIFPF